MSSRTFMIQMTDTQLRRIARALAALDALDPPADDDLDCAYLHDCCESTLALDPHESPESTIHGFAL